MAASEHLNPKQMGRRKRKDPFECKDCGVNTSDIDEYYMVHDRVWGAAGMEPNEAFQRGESSIYKPDGMLCIGCLEGRLGRRLNPADFTDAEVNTWRASDRLKSRQGRQ